MKHNDNIKRRSLLWGGFGTLATCSSGGSNASTGASSAATHRGQMQVGHSSPTYCRGILPAAFVSEDNLRGA